MTFASLSRRFWLAAEALAAGSAFSGLEWLIAWHTARGDFAAHTDHAPTPRYASGRSPIPITLGLPGSGRLHDWYSAPHNGSRVIVRHGSWSMSGATAASMVAEIRLLAEARFGVLAYDSPGFSGSPDYVFWADDQQAALPRAAA